MKVESIATVEPDPSISKNASLEVDNETSKGTLLRTTGGNKGTENNVNEGNTSGPHVQSCHELTKY